MRARGRFMARSVASGAVVVIRDLVAEQTEVVFVGDHVAAASSATSMFCELE